MSNFFPNGSVLPFGLLTEDQQSIFAAFAKTHQNVALRVGFVQASFPVGDPGNISKLCNEYNVVCIEQNEDRGITPITYKNCLSAEGLGSIADFFERSLRPQKEDLKKGKIDFVKQDGAIVLLLCLDGMSERGILIGSLTHPDRKTTLSSIGPRLEGEFNGVNIKVEEDGSTMLTFRGATNSKGVPVDSSQGDTKIRIEKDGSFQVDHKTITQRHDKNGTSTLTAEANIENTTKKSFKATAEEDILLTATKNLNGKMADMLLEASGSATIKCSTGKIEASSVLNVKTPQMIVEASGLFKVKGSKITLQGLVALGGEGGEPLLKLSAKMLGTGNLGGPVISSPIAGFTTKVTGQ